MNRHALLCVATLALLLPAFTGSESAARAAVSSPTRQLPLAPPAPLRSPLTVLYDQYDHSSIYTTNSQNYEASLLPYDDFLADDFVVSAGETWSIEEVDVAGLVYEGSGPVDSFNVEVYTDAPGVPGTLVYSASNLAYTTPVPPEFAIPLTPPAVLQAGTYWVMVQANLNWWTGNRGHWGWYDRSVTSNVSAAWYNPGDGWGTTCHDFWGRRTTCQGDAANPDQVYRLLGTGGGGTSTPTPLPPTPTRTATLANTPTSTPTGTATNTPPPGSTPTHTVTPCTISFTDVSASDYFYDAVRYLYCHGAISGYADGTFRPYNNTTRGQLSKIIVLAEAWTINTAGGPHFTDVPVGSTFYDYVETAYNRGAISGYSDGTFRPGNNVTRGQLSKIVVVAEGWPINTTGGPHFTDVAVGSAFYDWIETAYNRTIISGYADGTFRPGNSATRGQISKIVYNAITQP